eukprot:Tamp_23066.p3 GENE.Tamp_23066~~Tamp_23066.p3  ORF type:complete len:123 (+),score=10.19 Tamp_23066:245-613(+)
MPEIDPNGHSQQKELPVSFANLPEMQTEHDVALSVLYLPTAHWIQFREARTAEKLPGSQASHGPPSGPVNPRLQVQFDLRTLPFPENESDGHSQQKELPVSFANLPATQAEHTPLSHCASIE